MCMNFGNQFLFGECNEANKNWCERKRELNFLKDVNVINIFQKIGVLAKLT